MFLEKNNKKEKQIYERYKTNTLLFETYILSASRVLEKKSDNSSNSSDSR